MDYSDIVECTLCAFQIQFVIKIHLQSSYFHTYFINILYQSS